MKIKVENENGNVVFEGDAELYLNMEDNDTELELILNTLDYTGISEVYYGDLLIEKELELIYE